MFLPVLFLYQSTFFGGFLCVVCDFPIHPINWSLTTVKGSSSRERAYFHPAYSEVASSPCDLTENYCDISCCSDQDCSEDQKSSFTCSIKKQSKSLANYLNCKQDSLENLGFGLFNIFCYTILNTPYLGEYFGTNNKIESLPAINDVLSNKHNSFDFIDSFTSYFEDEIGALPYYIFGSPIKIRVNYMPTVVPTNLHHLKLPSSVLYNDGGLCVDTPVHFLVNKKSHCVRTISKELCQQNINSVFSALKYAVADSTDSTLSHLLPVVTSDNFGHNVTNTSVNYLCLKNGSDYVTFSKNVFNKLIIWSTDEFIDQDEDISPCDALPEDFKLTQIIEQDDICHNVLVSTSYEFMWSKGEIHNLHAVYILANIPLSPASFINSKYGINIDQLGGNSSSHFGQNVDYLNGDIENVHTYVTQHFSVKFTHVRLVDTDMGNITEEETLPVSFSGNPGYEVSRPLVVVMNNSLENDTSTGWKQGMVGIWSKGKKCEDILPVNFGYDVITTCSIELTLEDQIDCQVLRSHVLEVQELLISGEYITRGGADYRGDNTSIPVQRLVPILRSTKTNWSDVSDTDHTCSDVPARHILELLYTTALGTQGQPIHQVVGARTRIDTETWPLNVNLGDIMISHDFLLTSSVVFVQVPISDSPPRSRFWERMLSQEHSENAWRNILSALEPMTTGHEIAEVSVFTMSLVLLAVSLTALLWDQL